MADLLKGFDLRRVPKRPVVFGKADDDFLSGKSA